MINVNYAAFRETMNAQRKKLRELAGKVSDEMFEDIRDIYLPTLVKDVQESTPVLSGNLIENISFVLKRNKKDFITLTISAKAYNRGYNYAYIQHENVTYSHTHGTHHFISAPFERMMSDIAGDYGLSYTPPAAPASVFGNAKDYEKWSEGVERSDDE